MNSEIKELKEAIDIINDQMALSVDYGRLHTLELRYTGYSYSVYYLGVCIWNDDEDYREYIEDRNEYEPFLDYLIRTVNKEIENLSKIKLTKEMV